MNDTALIILAGGLGTRVGGANKALLPFAGKPLIEHVLANLASCASSVIISANRDIDRLQQYGFAVVPDLAQYHAMGPLAGIVSAARQLPAKIKYIQVVPCDLPFLSSDIIETLHQHLIKNIDLDIVYAADAVYRHPIICQMRRHHLSAINAQLESDGKHSVRAVIDPFPHLEVRFNHIKSFTNFNTDAMF
ncbi:molybdenum cofactor guanylyltransferase [Neisseriaceae bacterium ESL0693]|nr:molybdenum cofactor guanylyltransferase [Neisseriaceae bacterium ESL0693]